MGWRDDVRSIVGAIRSLIIGVWGRSHLHLEILLGDAVVYLTIAVLMHRLNHWIWAGSKDFMDLVIYELVRLGEFLFVFQFVLMAAIDLCMEVKRKVK